jgi:hypothetical protein
MHPIEFMTTRHYTIQTFDVTDYSKALRNPGSNWLDKTTVK